MKNTPLSIREQLTRAPINTPIYLPNDATTVANVAQRMKGYAVKTYKILIMETRNVTEQVFGTKAIVVKKPLTEKSLD